jgi:hypothetical protein
MARRKQIEQSGNAAADQPATAGLPAVESPPLSPAGAVDSSDAAPELVIEPIAPSTKSASEAAASPTAPAATLSQFPRLKWSRRNKRNAMLAASVMLAAALGAVLGAVSTAALNAGPPPRIDTAGLEERKAMQQSIAHLSRQVASLRTGLDAANKSAQSQVAKLGDKITERFNAVAADVTGSITPPQTVPPPPAALTPVPQPRPAIAAAEPALSRPSIVPGWTLRSARDGMAFVEGQGEIYQAVLGAPLPGLGPVQAIKREDGRWMVVTPRGIIVSMRDRRYFE